MKSGYLLLLLLSCQVALFAQSGGHIVISEFATQGPASGWDEFVELYNPGDAEVDLLGWKLQYKPSSATTWTDKAVFPVGAVIPAHGFFLVANTSYAGTDSADYTSSLWTSGNPVSSLGHFRLLDRSLTEIDKVGYGSAAIDPEGTPAPNQLLNTQSIERKAKASSTADSLKRGGLHYLEGNGYDTDDNGQDFVLQTNGRLPQTSRSVPEPAFGVGGNGTGLVAVSPSKVYSDRPASLTFTIAGDSGYTLTQIMFIVPAIWDWSGLATDILLSGTGFASASAETAGDTVRISHSSVTSASSGTIAIQGMTTPRTGGLTTFRFWTGVDSGVPAQILIQPSVRTIVPVPIADVHVNDFQGVPASPYGLNAEVTVTGTVTANLSFSQTNVFIQDGTGGINIFAFSRPMNFQPGDSLIVKGTILQFHGLTEITPDFASLVVVATGRPVPEPEVFTCAQVNATFQPDYSEPDEGRLVRINGVSYNPTAGTITDQTGTTKFFASFDIPYSQFDVIGILKQFKSTTSPPFTQDFEVQPRSEADVIPHPGPVIVEAPVEDSIGSSSVRIRWTTDVPSTSVVLFGESSVYTDSVTDASLTTGHAVWLSGLTPATFYSYAVASEDSLGRTTVSGFRFSTASPAGSTGVMNVYFNKDVNTTVSLGELANGNTALVTRLVQRIDSARRSVDAAFYNLSGSAGASIASALVRARDRGVLVRVIGEADNAGNAPFTTLSTNGIPFITDEFDPITFGAGLMHDKFVVIDGRGGAPESVWVWTGSWNPSDPGTNNDRQNTIEIQDVALAKAYLAEFNEMWGSPTQSANASLSRFGSRKLDDTPHRFNVNGTPVECYFSPSDRTTAAIGRALSRARASVCEAMYTFTRRELADTLIAISRRGGKVRVVMDNNSDTGTQFSVLVSGGVDVNLKGFSDGLLHHKYALVDATVPSGPQWTITGSHNWSSSAENSNNENTIIIQNTRITNLYLQEFYARYLEAGGSNPIVLGVRETGGALPKEFALNQNYPNPFNPVTVIRYALPVNSDVSLRVFDLLGREVAHLVNERQTAGNYEVTFDAGGIASGIYFYSLTAGGNSAVRKMMILK